MGQSRGGSLLALHKIDDLKIDGRDLLPIGS